MSPFLGLSSSILDQLLGGRFSMLSLTLLISCLRLSGAILMVAALFALLSVLHSLSAVDASSIWSGTMPMPIST